MKNIIHLFIAIFMFGVIAMSFKNTTSLTTTVIIQSKDKNISASNLSKSVEIISKRLKDFGSDQSAVIAVPEKKQIRITLSGNWDLKTATRLIIQKGQIGFYECYDRKELSDLLQGDEYLFSLFKSAGKNDKEVKIGCTSLSQMEKIEDYIESHKLNVKCKFTWSEPKDSEACLYALKRVILDKESIENIKPVKEKTSAYYVIEIRFKQSAVDAWSEATKRNLNKPVPILLDNKVLYAPVLKSEIKKGICSISGNLTDTDAKFLSSIGNSGILPVDFKIVE